MKIRTMFYLTLLLYISISCSKGEAGPENKFDVAAAAGEWNGTFSITAAGQRIGKTKMIIQQDGTVNSELIFDYAPEEIHETTGKLETDGSITITHRLPAENHTFVLSGAVDNNRIDGVFNDNSPFFSGSGIWVAFRN